MTGEQTIDKNYYFYCLHNPAGAISQCPICPLSIEKEALSREEARSRVTQAGEIVDIPNVNTPEVRAGMRGHRMMDVPPADPELSKLLAGNAPVRKFETGATRDVDTGKYDYEAFFCPLVLERRAKFMHKNRLQKDGSLRAGDNWQKGIPLDAYAKSLARHNHEFWKMHRGYDAFDEKGNPISLEDAICAAMFNLEGYLHEILKNK